MAQYVSESEFRESKMGVDIQKLGPGELTRWIERASDAIEDEAYWSFEKADGVVEKLRNSNEVVIDTDGTIFLYPYLYHPIRRVVSVSYQTPGGVAEAVPASDVDVIADNSGDGRSIAVYGDYARLRGQRLIWTVTYDGGYDAATPDDYPSWLRSCCLEWTAGLLQRRGAQAIVLEGGGGVADTSNIGKHLETAKGYLGHKTRRF